MQLNNIPVLLIILLLKRCAGEERANNVYTIIDLQKPIILLTTYEVVKLLWAYQWVGVFNRNHYRLELYHLRRLLCFGIVWAIELLVFPTQNVIISAILYIVFDSVCGDIWQALDARRL